MARICLLAETGGGSQPQELLFVDLSRSSREEDHAQLQVPSFTSILPVFSFSASLHPDTKPYSSKEGFSGTD